MTIVEAAACIIHRQHADNAELSRAYDICLAAKPLLRIAQCHIIAVDGDKLIYRTIAFTPNIYALNWKLCTSPRWSDQTISEHTDASYGSQKFVLCRQDAKTLGILT